MRHFTAQADPVTGSMGLPLLGPGSLCVYASVVSSQLQGDRVAGSLGQSVPASQVPGPLVEGLLLGIITESRSPHASGSLSRFSPS